MTHRNGSPVQPRNGQTLVVGIVARISGCSNQKEVSLEDQVDHGKEVVRELYDGPAEYRIISTKGKGERLDRPELEEVDRMLRTRELDLLVMEDLGRLVRGAEAVSLCGIAVDHGTRVIAPNDCIDTAGGSWEEDVISACRDHVGHNAHTSKRLKHKLMNRFLKEGGATAREPYGYIKPPGAKTYGDWLKDPAAEPYILEGWRRLMSTLNCSALADWFNRREVPVGKYCRRQDWTGAMVRRLYANTILKGQPSRGTRCTIKHNESGRRISVLSPNGPKYVEFPQLAYLSADEFDELNQLLASKNARYRRPMRNGTDSRRHVARKRTRFPGQHGTCWYCGRPYVWGANGMTGNLMCSGSREWRCWNSIGVCGELATKSVLAAITHELYQLDGFDDQFAELIRLGSTEDRSGISERWREQEQEEASLSQEKARVTEAIAKYGPLPMFDDKIREIEDREKSLALKRRKLERAQPTAASIPQSVAELRLLLEQQLEESAKTEYELAQQLQQLVPEFHVFLVRSVDGGHLLPRARIKLQLGATLPGVQELPEVSQLLTRVITLDLFKPSQRLRILPDAIRLAGPNVSHKEIARLIAEQTVERPTATAVGNALRLAKRMQELGQTSPFGLVESPPENYPKLRRHKNAKYRFEPLEGYRRPEL